jgi:hypothetical protein
MGAVGGIGQMKFKLSLTRYQFEKLLGGEFKDTDTPGYRTNGFVATWKGYSKMYQGQRAVFVTDGKSTAEGRNWGELAKNLGLR